MDAQWLFAIHLVATLYMTGVIWFVQLVHYPLFAKVPDEAYVEYERVHMARTTWAVGPPMLVELATALAMIIWPPVGTPVWLPWTGAVIVLCLFASTAFYYGPQHEKLASGFDASVHRALVGWNWLRTIGWSVRGAMLVWVACFCG